MAVVTTGFFDGVHLGHRHVLETVVSAARERGEEATVVTFWPHPRTVLQQDARDFRLLSSLEEKKALLTAIGIDNIEVIPFTRKFASLKADEYLQLLQSRYNASLIVMGYDNRIGSDRKTAQEYASAFPSAEENYFSGRCPKNQFPSAITSPTLAETLPVITIKPVCHSERSEESPISSTLIRKALMAGEIEEANAMLGYEYGLHGVVVAGNHQGRTIGFPTANMQLYEPLKLIPQNGVYAVNVEVTGNVFRGMCNIGTRPTVGGTARTIETHILGFDEDIYGLPLRVRFLRRLRDERKFPSLEALREQLVQDALNCKK